MLLRLLVLLVTVFAVTVGGQSLAPAPAHADPICDIVGGIAGVAVGGAAIGPGCEAATELGGEVVDQVWDSGFGKVAKSMLDGMGTGLQWALSWWIKIPSPDLTEFTGLQQVRDYTFEIQMILLTVSVVFTAGRLAKAKRSSMVGETEEMFGMYARVVFTSWIFTSLVVMVSKASDAFSNWVIGEVTGDDPGQMIENYLKIDALTKGTFGVAPLFLIGLIGFLGAIAQIVLLVVRQVFLIVVVGILPVTAAASGTGAGSQSYQKLMAWTIGAVAFKFVGALVYVIAFTSAKTDSGDQQQILLGIILLALIAFVFPVVHKLAAPAVNTMGSGGSGLGAAVGLAAAGAALAGGGALRGASGARSVGNTSQMATAGPSLGGGGGFAGGGFGGGGGRPSGGGGGGGAGGGARRTGGGGPGAGSGGGGGGTRSSWSQRASSGAARGGSARRGSGRAQGGTQSGGTSPTKAMAGAGAAATGMGRAVSNEARTPTANGEVPQ